MATAILPPPVIPQMRFLAAAQRAAVAENHPGQIAKMLAHGVKPHLARGGHQRMPVQDDNSPALPARQFFQPLAQFQFLRHEEFIAEAADFAERRRLDKNKRAGQQLERPAGVIPQLRDAAGHEMLLIQPHRRAAGQIFAGLDLFRHVREQSGAGMRVRVHKNQPVAGGRRRAAVSRAGNLVDRLENHRRARRARDFRRPVGGIVVADNQFKIPAPLRERSRRRFDLRERTAEQPLFVERGNDN